MPPANQSAATAQPGRRMKSETASAMHSSGNATARSRSWDPASTEPPRRNSAPVAQATPANSAQRQTKKSSSPPALPAERRPGPIRPRTPMSRSRHTPPRRRAATMPGRSRPLAVPSSSALPRRRDPPRPSLRVPSLKPPPVGSNRSIHVHGRPGVQASRRLVVPQASCHHTEKAAVRRWRSQGRAVSRRRRLAPGRPAGTTRPPRPQAQTAGRALAHAPGARKARAYKKYSTDFDPSSTNPASSDTSP